MDRIMIKCCRECNLQNICKEKYPGKFPPCRDEAVANFSTSTNNESLAIALMDKMDAAYSYLNHETLPNVFVQALNEWHSAKADVS